MKDKGSVFLVVVFAIALLSALTIGILQMTTEEIQVLRNQIYAADALAIAEAGLNDAFSELRVDPNWADGFQGKTFNDGSYTVGVSGSLPSLTIESTGTSGQSFVAKVEADITVGTSSPYIIQINNLRINE